MLPRKMLPRSSPDGIHIAFDDHRLVNNAGLILPATLGCVVKAPSTLGTFLRSFRWGHVRQLDRVSRQSCWPGPGLLGPAPATC